MKLGKISWYGGTTREGKVNKYGFLVDAEGNNHRIKEQVLQGTLRQPRLTEGISILFEMDKKEQRVEQVVAITEASAEQLLGAYKIEWENPVSRLLVPRLLESEKRSELIIFVTEQMLVTGKQVKTCPLLKFTDEERIAYFLQLEQLSERQLEDVACLVKSYHEALNEKILEAVSLGHTVGSNYEVATIQLYKAFAGAVELDMEDWHEFFDDPVWRPTILAQLEKAISEHKVDRSSWRMTSNTMRLSDIWECLTPKQWFSCPEATALLETNADAYKRMTILHANDVMKGTGVTEALLEKVLDCLKIKNDQTLDSQTYSGTREMLTRLLADELLLHPEIYPVAARSVLLKRLEQLAIKQEVLPYYIALFDQLKEKERAVFLQEIPAQYRNQHDPFFAYLTAEEQVNISFGNFVENPFKIWAMLKDEAKTLFVYRVAQVVLESPLKKQVYGEIFRSFGKEESNPQLKGVLLLLDAVLFDVQQEELKQLYFNRMRSYIEEEILRQLKANEPLKLLPILPRCHNKLNYCKIAYCEGRYYDKIQAGAYCPRARKACYFKSSYGKLSGSHIKGNVNRKFSDWSLHELLVVANIQPNMPELIHENNQDTYVNKLAGWVNRIEELRERLKCSHCREAFIVDWSQSSRFHAVYNATVYSCQHQEETTSHDKNVYISHCRCCYLTIDSRESRFKVQPDGTHYVCIHCGGAEQRLDYKQGDMCPACGIHEPMNKLYENGNWYECRHCHHEIKIGR